MFLQMFLFSWISSNITFWFLSSEPSFIGASVKWTEEKERLRVLKATSEKTAGEVAITFRFRSQ